MTIEKFLVEEVVSGGGGKKYFRGRWEKFCGMTAKSF